MPSDSTHIVSPRISSIFLQIDSPSPAPEYLALLFSLLNGSNIIVWNCFFIPIPLSVIDTIWWFSTFSVFIFMIGFRGAAVNFIAFDSRFCITCISSPGCALTVAVLASSIVTCFSSIKLFRFCFAIDNAHPISTFE